MYLEFARENILIRLYMIIYIARYHSYSSRYSSYFNIEKHKNEKKFYHTLI